MTTKKLSPVHMVAGDCATSCGLGLDSFRNVAFTEDRARVTCAACIAKQKEIDAAQHPLPGAYDSGIRRGRSE